MSNQAQIQESVTVGVLSKTLGVCFIALGWAMLLAGGLIAISVVIALSLAMYGAQIPADLLGAGLEPILAQESYTDAMQQAFQSDRLGIPLAFGLVISGFPIRQYGTILLGELNADTMKFYPGGIKKEVARQHPAWWVFTASFTFSLAAIGPLLYWTMSYGDGFFDAVLTPVGAGLLAILLVGLLAMFAAALVMRTVVTEARGRTLT